MKTTSLVLGLTLASGFGAGCRGATSKETPVYGIRNMYDQPKYDVQKKSEFFADHRTMRPLVEGVVAHEEDVDPEIALGRLEDGSGYVLEVPKQLYGGTGGADAFVKRGQERYGIYCGPCHGSTGNGYGLVRKRAVAGGATAFIPPTFHQDRLRKAPDGQIFATISNGKNNMPPYAMQIQPADRWAIVAYVRALQTANPQVAGISEEPSQPASAATPTNAMTPGVNMAPSTDAGITGAKPGVSAAPLAPSTDGGKP